MRKTLVIAALVGLGTNAQADPPKLPQRAKPPAILADFEVRTKPLTNATGFLSQRVARSGAAVTVSLPGSVWECISTPVDALATEETASLTCFYGDAVASIRASCAATTSEVSVMSLVSGKQTGTPYTVAIACSGRAVNVPANLAP
jgi:hypothetical protein